MFAFGQWVTNKIYSVHFLTVSVSFEIKKNVIIKNVIGSVGMRRMSFACTSRADITGGPRHNRVTWYVKTFRNVNYVC